MAIIISEHSKSPIQKFQGLKASLELMHHYLCHNLLIIQSQSRFMLEKTIQGCNCQEAWFIREVFWRRNYTKPITHDKKVAGGHVEHRKL